MAPPICAPLFQNRHRPNANLHLNLTQRKDQATCISVWLLRSRYSNLWECLGCLNNESFFRVIILFKGSGKVVVERLGVLV